MFVRPRFIHIPGIANTPGSTPVVASESVLNIYTAGATINGHRIVKIADDGRVMHADHIDLNDSNDRILGLSTQSAVVNDSVRVLNFGPLEEPTWNWDMAKVLFLGADGALVQDPPLTGFVVQVGFPLAPTSLFLRIERPIILS